MKIKNIVVSVVVAVAFAVVCAVTVWQQFPQLAPAIDIPSKSEDGVTETTTGTTTYYQYHYLLSDPAQWHEVGEVHDWNDEYTFCADSVTVGKSFPEGCHMEEFSRLVTDPPDPSSVGYEAAYFSVESDANGTLTSDHLFVDVMWSATFLGEKEKSLFGITLVPEEQNYYCSGGLILLIYDREQKAIVDSSDMEELLPVTEDNYDWGGAYQLDIGESATVRTIFIVDQEYWESDRYDVVLTWGRYNAEQMQWIGYTQPYVWIDKEV